MSKSKVLAGVLGRSSLVFAAFGFILMLATLAAAPAQAGNRVALVIANSSYRAVARLPNPPRDAQVVANTLKQAGFNSVDIMGDLDQAGMDRAFRAFGAKARGAEVALVYYAGHGIEAGGRNFLIPIDAKLQTSEDLDVEATPLEGVMRMVQGANVRIILLDACRQNPFTSMRVADQGRSIGRGLSRVEPPNQTLVMYAAKDGTIAADGAGANSPFATALSQRLAAPGVPINRIFRQVRDDVIKLTASRQQPVIYDQTSSEDFYLRPEGSGTSVGATVAAAPAPAFVPPVVSNPAPSIPAASAPAMTTAVPATGAPATAYADTATEAGAWGNVTNFGTIGALESYLNLYPTGPHVGEATVLLRQRYVDGRTGPAVASARAGQVITADDYPSRAIREERGGTTVMQFEVTATGRVENCQIAASSGHADLDETSCQLLVRRARYLPALDAGGNPVRSTSQRRTLWQVPK